MSISELNHFMTYVIDGWLLFSAGFISIGFVSFVSRRIQEDIEADAVALAQQMEAAVAEAEEISTVEAEQTAVQQTILETPTPSDSNAGSPQPPTTEEPGAPAEDPSDTVDEEALEAARLEEVAAVSEQLAKTKEKQSGTSSVSVST